METKPRMNKLRSIYKLLPLLLCYVVIFITFYIKTSFKRVIYAYLIVNKKHIVTGTLHGCLTKQKCAELVNLRRCITSTATCPISNGLKRPDLTMQLKHRKLNARSGCHVEILSQI